MSYLQILGGVEDKVQARLALVEDAKVDVVSFVGPGAEGSSLDDAQLREVLCSEALFFNPPGGEIISTALSALFYPNRNREAYAKLAKEPRTAFTCGANIRDGAKACDISIPLRLCR